MTKRPDQPQERKNSVNKLFKNPKVLAGIILLIAGTIFLVYYFGINSREAGAPGNGTDEKTEIPPVESQVEDETDPETGLVTDEGFELVRTTCTACHSSDLILQNRYTREGWHDIIVWMQETQGLWDLGENEALILDYLEANYAPKESRGRRRPLEHIKWYELEE